ncbi:MAG: M14 family metallocarboxypeptidase [Armatimonadota bacterium]|nr:M14 family metallocarboxypeptidase [Armatimonadota bacterium]
MDRSYTELIARLKQVETSSRNVRMRELGDFRIAEREYTLYRIDLKGGEPGPVRVCISAGMHGDEPAGIEAAARFLEKSANNESLLTIFSFVIFPCDNPSGYELDTRYNALGVDLNREFNTRRPADEVAILQNAVEGEQFDHVYELHEDVDSYGLYLYELAVDSSLRVGPEIIRAVSAAGYPINLDECIEGREARCGVIAPGISRFRKTRLPKALYMARLGARHVMTLETPGRALPVEDRVTIQLMALAIALERARGRYEA